MDLRVCQVTSARSVVVNTAPGLRALISRSTSQTCWPAGDPRLSPNWNDSVILNRTGLNCFDCYLTMKEINSGSVDKRIEIILSAWVVIKRYIQFNCQSLLHSHCISVCLSGVWMMMLIMILLSEDHVTIPPLHFHREGHGIIALNSISKHTSNLTLLFTCK